MRLRSVLQRRRVSHQLLRRSCRGQTPRRRVGPIDPCLACIYCKWIVACECLADTPALLGACSLPIEGLLGHNLGGSHLAYSLLQNESYMKCYSLHQVYRDLLLRKERAWSSQTSAETASLARRDKGAGRGLLHLWQLTDPAAGVPELAAPGRGLRACGRLYSSVSGGLVPLPVGVRLPPAGQCRPPRLRGWGAPPHLHTHWRGSSFKDVI